MKQDTIPGVLFSPIAAQDECAGALITRDGDVTTVTSRGELIARVRGLGMGLHGLGISVKDRVAILLENSPEWIISDLAVLTTGAAVVPVYPTLTPDETRFILQDSGVSAVIFSPAHAKKLSSIRHELTDCTLFIATEALEGGQGGCLDDGEWDVTTLDEVSGQGRDADDDLEAAWRAALERITPQDTFSVIYTSGTTGRPKGVVLTHENMLSNIEAVLSIVEITGKDTYLSFLPLSHIFERMVHHLLIKCRATIAYSKGFAFVGADAAFFRPTLMIGVPFFFERIKTKVCEGVKRSGAVKRFIFERALHMQAGAREGLLSTLFDGLALKTVRDKIGPRIRFFISGGAALSRDTAEFFGALGLPILEGYGLTETAAVVSVNTLAEARFGTVGRALPGVEVRLTGQGEILVKGPNVMRGYLDMPEATAKTIKDGWFHTGDIGDIDADGFITITDRKKDMIVTSAGKNIAPQRIEGLLRSDEYIKEALVYGDGHTHLVALVVPDLEWLSGEFSREKIKGLDVDSEVYGFYEGRIKERLKGLARFEQIRRFAFIPHGLSQSDGELTPTLKVRRERVAEKYSDVIETLYEI